jgi:alpha-glucosidase
VFDWELVGAPWTGASLGSILAKRETVFGDGRWPTTVMSNHDQPRHASRLAESVGATDRDAVARAAGLLLLTLRGTPFLYYGEELGLGDVDIPPNESLDPPAARVGPDFEWRDRSRCRTPMPWTSGPGAGFTTGRPWLRLGPDADTRNVAAQWRDPGSVLAFYRRLIALRAATPALQVGSLRLPPATAGDVVAYTREAAGQVILIALNLSRAAVTWPAPAVSSGAGWRPLLSTMDPKPPDTVLDDGATTVLEPDEGLILERIV